MVSLLSQVHDHRKSQILNSQIEIAQILKTKRNLQNCRFLFYRNIYIICAISPQDVYDTVHSRRGCQDMYVRYRF